MDATFLTTLRRLFPRVTLKPAGDEELALGAVVGVAVRAGALVVTLEHGGELSFHADLPSWRAMNDHLRTGELKFDDPERGLQRLAEILGTLRDHFDA
jgi:hypothetical protein